MKLGIMQPYFFPYIGYFQLISSVDKFVIYDNIKYTKKGWINRNRIIANGKDQLFTIPLRNGSDYLDINQRKLSYDYQSATKKILRKIEASYKKAPYYDKAYPVIADCLLYKDKNLFNFIYYSIKKIKKYLDIKTEILISSQIEIKKRLKGELRVLSICKQLKADQYINAIGGMELYDKKRFLKDKIKLNFIKSKPIKYKQFDNVFIPWLSIIDIMMFNSQKEINKMLNDFELI